MCSYKQLSIVGLLLLTTFCYSYKETYVRTWKNEYAGQEQLIRDKKVVAEYHFQLDKNKLRLNPHNLAGARKKYAIFMGCSYTFGQFVSEFETMPYYFSIFKPNYNTYNYAATGSGPHITLSNFLEQRISKKHIPETTGIGIYVYIPDHIRRISGNLAWLRTGKKHRDEAYFYINNKNELHLHGKMKDRLWAKILTPIMDKLNLTEKYQLPKLSEYHLKLTVAIIQGIRQEYNKEFKNDNFFVILYPSTEIDPTKNFLIIKYLKKYNIKFIDLSLHLTPQEAISSIHGHPLPEGNQKAMRIFTKYFEQRPESKAVSEQISIIIDNPALIDLRTALPR